LEKTIKKAMQVAESGEVLLYSPAFSSFGRWFKNEYDRGDQFKSIISDLV
jgi:UDP-N-acetylmuramoylalanine-D-glutamate ligase